MKSTCKILIADDEYWVRENLRNLINWQEHSFELLEPAVDGEDALNKIEAERPDILITDVNMPFVSGTELIRRAREIQPQIQSVVVSGYSDFSFVREALLGGAVDYLLKPVTKNDLLNILDKILGILGSNREQQQEQTKLRDKLMIASSLLQDEELSTLITEDSPAARTLVAQMELEFAVFSLVIVRLADMRAALEKFGGDFSRLCCEVKNTARQKIPGGRVVVFHNIYVRNEFIVITDLDEKGIDALCKDLTEALCQSTSSASSIGVSNHYFALGRLRHAYHEARSTLLLHRLGSSCLTVCAKDVQSYPVQRRVPPEQEKRLLYAFQTRNRVLAEGIIFQQLGLNRCTEEGWLFIELKQAAEQIAGMVTHRTGQDTPPQSTLAMQNLNYLLGMALEAQDVTEVCSVIEQMLEEAFGEPTRTGTSDSILKTVLRVQKYIEEKYFEEISLTSLSKLFWVDRNYLSRAFKQVTGSNLMLAIAKKRIEKAAEFIMQSNLSLTEISYLVGYEDYSYFNRVFHKIKGISPREYKTVMLKEGHYEGRQCGGGAAYS